MELFNELDNSAGSKSVKSTIFTVPFHNNSDSDSDENENENENENDINTLIYDSPQSSQQVMLEDTSAYGKHQMNVFGENQIVNEFSSKHNIKDNIIKNIRKRLEGKVVNDSGKWTNTSKTSAPIFVDGKLLNDITQTNLIEQNITQTNQIEDNITQTIQVEENATQTIQIEEGATQTIQIQERATQTKQGPEGATQTIRIREDATQTNHFGEFVTQTQQISNVDVSQLDTQLEQNSASDDDDNDDQLVVTQRLKSRTIIEDEDDEDEDEDEDQKLSKPEPESKKLTYPFNYNDENQLEKDSEDISNQISNYKLLSRDEKIKARVAELQKLRENNLVKDNNKIQEESEIIIEAENKDTNEDDDENIITSKGIRKSEKDKKLERLKEQAKLIKHSELIKKSSPIIRLINRDKFTTKKFIENFNRDSDSDSDSDSPHESIKLFSDENSKTPLSSPKHENVVKNNLKPLVSIKKFIHNPHNDNKNVINLSSDSSDAENYQEIDKAKTLSIKYKFSKKLKKSDIRKSKNKLDSIITRKLIKEHRDRERLKNNDEVSKILQKTSIDDNEILKLYYQQQEFEKNLRAKEIEEKKSLKKRKRILLSGKLPTHDDDPEYSEFSSNEEIEEEEEENEEEVDERKKNDKENSDVESDDESDNETGIKFQLLPSRGIKGMNISLSDLADSTLPSFTQNELTSLEKFKKLRGDDEINKLVDNDNNESMVGDTTESFIRNNLNNSNDQLINKMLKSIEFDDEKNESKNNLEVDGDNLREILDSQNLLMETQADEGTQLIEDEKILEHDNDDDDDDDDDDEKIKSSRKIQLENIDNVNDNEADREDNNSDDDDDEEEEEDEEARLASLVQIKLAKEDEKRKRRQREKEFRSKGLNTIMEKEAVESDDEYQGIGGVDRDVSDIENSEDEKMIDDGSKINVNEDEIRRNINKEDLEQDQKDVQKVFKDIKTGALRKRRAKDGAYDLELSDDDDGMAILEKLRKRQLYEQQHLRDGTNNSTINDPAKAFFDAISFNNTRSVSSFQFEQQMISLSDSDSDGKADEENEKETLSKEKTPGSEGRSSEGPMKKKRRTSEEYRISINSYLEENNNDPSTQSVIIDLSDDDGLEEIKNIKKNTRIKSSSIIKKISNDFSQDTQTIDDSDDVDSFSVLASRSGSVTASFKKSTKKLVKISENTGNIIREVNVTTSSKPAMHSKGAVTKLASSENLCVKKEKTVIKGSKLDRLEKKLQNTRRGGNLRKLVGTKGFR